MSTRLRICDDGLSEHHQRFQRNSAHFTPYTFFAWFQPWVAWIGLVGCLVVFVFVSATWWSTAPNFTKVAEAYGAVSSFLFMINSIAFSANSVIAFHTLSSLYSPQDN